jgi:hypothetical protein
VTFNQKVCSNKTVAIIIIITTPFHFPFLLFFVLVITYLLLSSPSSNLLSSLCPFPHLSSPLSSSNLSSSPRFSSPLLSPLLISYLLLTSLHGSSLRFFSLLFSSLFHLFSSKRTVSILMSVLMKPEALKQRSVNVNDVRLHNQAGPGESVTVFRSSLGAAYITSAVDTLLLK